MINLVKKAKNGDKEAFSKLIFSVQNDLYRIANIRLSNYDNICEAVQNTIVNAYLSINKLREEKYFKTWIIKILINECNHIYSNNKNIMELDSSLKYFQGKDDINDTISNLDFQKLLNFLNYEEKTIVMLFYAENFSVNQISKILDKPKSTITTKLSRSRNKLKKILEGGLYE